MILRDKIGRLRGAIERVLPDGCPVIIGGGLVRDALYGGRPNDIDVWLPSNIHVPDVDAFCGYMVNAGFGPRQGFQGQAVFRGPGSRVEEVTEGIFGGFGDAEHDNAGYGDVHNHWVVEIQSAPDAQESTPGYSHPRINIMRNMARWNGDAPSFFTEIMRNFDLDLCMYFVGYMPGQNSVNTVIMPRHLHDSIVNRLRNNTVVVRPRMNEVYWNQARLQTTSTERILSRVRKMNQKYTLSLSENINNIQMIPTNEIVAVPVRFIDIIGCFNGDLGYGVVPIPTRANSVHLHVHEAAVEAAQGLYEQWRDAIMSRGGPVPRAVGPSAFIRYQED
jgi:hypothetical protein